MSAAGPAMVEFRQSESTGEFVLMAINGKFWGSLELSLAAGVNFAADLIRFQRGKRLPSTGGSTAIANSIGPWTEIS